MSHLRKVTKLETNLSFFTFQAVFWQLCHTTITRKYKKNKNLKFDLLLLLLYIIHYVKYTTSVVAQ